MYANLIKWFEDIRLELKIESLSEVVFYFKEQLPECYEIIILGSFDEKVIVVSYKNGNKIICFSIDKPLCDTVLYSKKPEWFNFNMENLTSIFISYLVTSVDEIKALLKPNTALVSLAKPDIYTYPRFALGVSYIAYKIRKNLLGSVTLFDLQLSDSLDTVVDEIAKGNYDILGISMTFGLYDVLLTFLEAIKRKKIRIRIVIGGSLSGIVYEEILNDYKDAIVCLSEGEGFIENYVNLLNNDNLEKINTISSIAYYDKKAENIALTKNDAKKSWIFPIPEFDLLLSTLYKKGVFQIETSRGCYNACSFCPRRHKGTWRGSINDVEKISSIINYFCGLVKKHGLKPERFISYIVDEEFIGVDEDINQYRAVSISEIFQKHNIKYEVSFRMNTVFSSMADYSKNLQKLSTLISLRNNGLNRVLVGVESGVQSVLERFNKNITSMENITGIRLLTGLSIPTRFTYITFDPLMTFDELIETYLFQGRTDLILCTELKNSPSKLLQFVMSDEISLLLINKPFYHDIPYMLVSMECLLGSQYTNTLAEHQLLGEKINMSIGKQESVYLDKNIGLMSHFSQLWVDKNFTLDYTLKSLSKIYTLTASLAIREERIVFKKHAYNLLGKMIYTLKPQSIFLNGFTELEKEMAIKCNRDWNAGIDLNDIYMSILNHQFQLLIEGVERLALSLKEILETQDWNDLIAQINKWKSETEWQSLHSL